MASLSEQTLDIHKYISLALLAVWLVTGCFAAFATFVQIPDGNREARVLIENHAKAWIGFAIAAVSLYLGFPKRV